MIGSAKEHPARKQLDMVSFSIHQTLQPDPIFVRTLKCQSAASARKSVIFANHTSSQSSCTKISRIQSARSWASQVTAKGDGRLFKTARKNICCASAASSISISILRRHFELTGLIIIRYLILGLTKIRAGYRLTIIHSNCFTLVFYFVLA